MLSLIFLSFVSGILTILAPCILPLLPVLISSSVVGNWKRPFRIIASLFLVLIIITFVLKFTAITCAPDSAWKWVTVTVFFIFGILLLFPKLWEVWPVTAKFNAYAQNWLSSGYKKHSVWGDVIVGAALAPVFTSCSPTYVALVAIILPVSFGSAIVYLIAYLFGIALILFLIAFLGQKIIGFFSKLANPQGVFRRILGIIFILTAIGFACNIGTVLREKYADPLNTAKIEMSLSKWFGVSLW